LTHSSSDLFSVTTSWPRAGLAVVTVRGEVDSQTKAGLEKEVDGVMAAPFPRQLVVDLDEVGFIGAAGKEAVTDRSVGWVGRECLRVLEHSLPLTTPTDQRKPAVGSCLVR
jgi:hypothetical protein